MDVDLEHAMTQDKDPRVVRYFESLPSTSVAWDLLHELCAAPPYTIAPLEQKPLYLYGAGNLGRLAFDYCQSVGLTVEGVIDREAARHKLNKDWRGVNLMAPDEATDLMKRTGRLVVSIVNLPWGDIATSLVASGWHEIMPFYELCTHYCDVHPLDNGWLTGPLTAEDQSGIKMVLSNYADDVSRAHHLQFTAWHALHQEWIFSQAPVVIEDRYFIPEIVARLNDHESFIDLGAYHGDVVLRFLQLMNNRFTSILAVEPDRSSVTCLRARLQSLPETIRSKLAIRDIVLGKEEKMAQFRDGLGYASRLVEHGGAPVHVHTLDSLNVAPSFIKLHLEGSEMDVLLGSRQTIKDCRPIITLTIYHDRMGLWRTAKRLMEEFGAYGYEFYFRQHGWLGTGALIYLIPRTR